MAGLLRGCALTEEGIAAATGRRAGRAVIAATDLSPAHWTRPCQCKAWHGSRIEATLLEIGSNSVDFEDSSVILTSKNSLTLSSMLFCPIECPKIGPSWFRTQRQSQAF